VLSQAEINMNSAHNTASEVASVSVQRPAFKDDFLDKHLVAIVAPSTILIDLNEKVNQSTENIAPGAPNS
jgi:hypothetical protein